MIKYGLSVRLSERTKNMSKDTQAYIESEKNKIISYCHRENIILDSPHKIKETSVVNQIWDGIKYAAKNKLVLYRIYIDLYITGSNWERKEILQMLNDYDDGFIKGFVFKNLDRYARDLYFQEEIIKNYRDIKGAEFFLIDGQELMDDEVSRKFVGVANELPVIQGKKSAKKTFKTKQEQGLPCVPAPFGYKYKNKNWVVVKKQAEIVKEVVARTQQKEPYSDTCRDLKISKYKYYKILENARKGLYGGLITYTKHIKNLKGKVVKTEEISYKGNYEHILE